MDWIVKRVINFEKGGLFEDGYAQFGFHDSKGRQYVINADKNWIGLIEENNSLVWSAGDSTGVKSPRHFSVDFKYPVYITDTPEGKLLVSSSENKRIYVLDPEKGTAKVLIDGESEEFTDLGNCVLDAEGNIWINEVRGCRLRKFSSEGKPLLVLGTGQPGFQKEACSFEEVQFNWIFDIRPGPDGNIYVLDSKNYAVRMVDLYHHRVVPIAGTGKSGYTGDGGKALEATFGSTPGEYFDGPWSLSLDEAGNIFVGDTQNHVIRRIDRITRTITTIAGNYAITPGLRNDPGTVNPINLNLPRICGMDYYKGNLFIPEWDGDLIVLARKTS